LAPYACRLCPCQQPCRWIMRRAQNLRFWLTLSTRCALIAAEAGVHAERWRCIKYDLAAVCAAVVGIAKSHEELMITARLEHARLCRRDVLVEVEDVLGVV
jgi:hypothetical protein